MHPTSGIMLYPTTKLDPLNEYAYDNHLYHYGGANFSPVQLQKIRFLGNVLLSAL